VTLLDAYAIVAFLAGGPAARPVRTLLDDHDVGVATANLAEALEVTERVYGVTVERSHEVLRPLLEGGICTIPLDARLARTTAEIRARHYHRSRCPISLADAVLIATADDGHRLATADPDLLVVAAARGIETIALPGQG
jgi:predicted nucleic acid-binding protein